VDHEISYPEGARRHISRGINGWSVAEVMSPYAAVLNYAEGVYLFT
jgi:hypothetical protein